jgi:hypothetical protein
MQIVVVCLTPFTLTFDMLSPASADTQFVQDRIDTAFRLIANTVTELNRNPINTDIQNLHTTLFGEPFDSTKIINILARFDELSRISPLNNADQTGRTVNGHTIAADVRFYCTTSRIKKKLNTEKNVMEYRNMDRNVAYKDGALSSPGGRYANCFDVIEPTLMITMTVAGQFSEIQICPWYLRKARGFAIRDVKDLAPSIIKYMSHIALPLVARFIYRPIDLFVLTDKVIVHELTHTGQAVFPTIDMSPAAYGGFTLASLFLSSSHLSFARVADRFSSRLDKR